MAKIFTRTASSTSCAGGSRRKRSSTEVVRMSQRKRFLVVLLLAPVLSLLAQAIPVDATAGVQSQPRSSSLRGAVWETASTTAAAASSTRRRANETESSFASSPFQISSTHELCRDRQHVQVHERRSEDWYHQCQTHLRQADTVPPWNEWTMTEFVDFVVLHVVVENPKDDDKTNGNPEPTTPPVSPPRFHHLPLPLIMMFHELSCRCRQPQQEDDDDDVQCCVGSDARMAPPVQEDQDRWTRSICQRVDRALDGMCFPQRSSYGSSDEL